MKQQAVDVFFPKLLDEPGVIGCQDENFYRRPWPPDQGHIHALG